MLLELSKSISQQENPMIIDLLISFYFMEDVGKEHTLFKPTFSLVSVHTHVFTDQMVPPSVRAE